MTQGLNLQQQIQQLSQQRAHDFYAQSIGSLKSQIQNYREQLEQYTQQLPEGDAKAQIEEMIDYYYELEGSIDQAGQVAGQAQDTAGQATQQVQDTAGQVTDQAGQAAGQVQDTVSGLTGGLTGGQQQGGPLGGGTGQVGQT